MARPPQRVRQTPAISANDLALFMLSSDTARIGIIRRAKFPQRPPIIRYRDARPPICQYLTDLRRSVNPLVAAEHMFSQRAEDPSMSALRQDDARQSIEVMHAIQRMTNQLAQYDFQQAPQTQQKLVLADVGVSVHADLLVHGTQRGVEQVGGAILRMTQDDADTESARARRQTIGQYVATLLRLHVERNVHSNRQPANRLCLSIDVQHGEAFVCPASIARRISDLENACRFIAVMWPTVI